MKTSTLVRNGIATLHSECNPGKSSSPQRRRVTSWLELPVTILLNLIALILEFGLAIPIGILATTRHDTWLDKGITVFVFVGFAVPTLNLRVGLLTGLDRGDRRFA